MNKLSYLLSWLITAVIVIISGTIICPFALAAFLFLAAKSGWPKTAPKTNKYNLTPPPREVIIQN